MAKDCDITTKDLLDAGPAAWLKLAGIDVAAPVVLMDSDVSAITMEADRVLAIQSEPRWIVHIEFQTSHETRMPLRLQRYNVVLEYKHEVPVQSLLILFLQRGRFAVADRTILQLSPQRRLLRYVPLPSLACLGN